MDGRAPSDRQPSHITHQSVRPSIRREGKRKGKNNARNKSDGPALAVRVPPARPLTQLSGPFTQLSPLHVRHRHRLTPEVVLLCWLRLLPLLLLLSLLLLLLLQLVMDSDWGDGWAGGWKEDWNRLPSLAIAPHPPPHNSNNDEKG